MKELNDIEKVLRDKLQNFEAPVRDGLWTNIQSSVSSSSSTAAAASSKIGAILLKTVAAISVVGIGTYLVVKNIDSSKEKVPTTIAVETSNSNSIDEQTATQGQDINKVKSNQTKNNTEEKVSTHTPTVNSTELNKNNPSNSISSPLIKETNKKSDEVKGAEPTSNPTSTNLTSVDNKEALGEEEPKSAVDKGVKEAKKAPAEIKNPADVDSNIAPKVDEETPKIANLELTLPNVITPNGDGNNDVLIIKTPALKKFVMEVYNNRAELIFRSTDQNIGWDGQDLSGNPVSEGSYLYKITAEGEDGTVYGTKTQTILVTR